MTPHCRPKSPFCSVSLRPASTLVLVTRSRCCSPRRQNSFQYCPEKTNVTCNDSSSRTSVSISAALTLSRRTADPTASPSHILSASSRHQQPQSIRKQPCKKYQKVQSERNSTQIYGQHDASVPYQIIAREY